MNLMENITNDLIVVAAIDTAKETNQAKRVEAINSAHEQVAGRTREFQEKSAEIIDAIAGPMQKVSSSRSFRIGSIPTFGKQWSTDISITKTVDSEVVLSVQSSPSDHNYESFRFRKVNLSEYLTLLPTDEDNQKLIESLRTNTTKKGEIFMSIHPSGDLRIEPYDASLPSILQQIAGKHLGEEYDSRVSRETAGQAPGTLFNFDLMAEESTAKTVNQLLDPVAHLSVSVQHAKTM